MLYITGHVAFGIPDRTSESCGIWNIRKSEFLGEDSFKQRDSSTSVFGDWGIQKGLMVPYHEFCTYNVANHARAYCDMLEMGQAADMKGLFAEAIDNAKVRMDIFMLVYGKLRGSELWPFINSFFMEEFGNAWDSYKKSVKKNAEVLSESAKEFDALIADKKAYESREKSKLIDPPECYLEG